MIALEQKTRTCFSCHGDKTWQDECFADEYDKETEASEYQRVTEDYKYVTGFVELCHQCEGTGLVEDVCYCYAYCSCECSCGAWDDVECSCNCYDY